jgi:hypothetical protein
MPGCWASTATGMVSTVVDNAAANRQQCGHNVRTPQQGNTAFVWGGFDACPEVAPHQPPALAPLAGAVHRATLQVAWTQPYVFTCAAGHMLTSALLLPQFRQGAHHRCTACAVFQAASPAALSAGSTMLLFTIHGHAPLAPICLVVCECEFVGCRMWLWIHNFFEKTG